MKIDIYTIEKHSRDEYGTITEQYRKMISKYATINEHNIFNKKISSAQNKNAQLAPGKLYTGFFTLYERL